MFSNTSDFNNQSYLLDNEFKTSPQIINTQLTYQEIQKEKKVRHIEGMLRLGNLNKVFCVEIGLTDVEMLFKYFNEKYDFSLGEENPFNFIIDVIGFSLGTLRLARMDKEEYYFHRSISESLEIVLNNLLDQNKLINTKNGFPESLDIQNNQINTLVNYNSDSFLLLSDNNFNIKYNQVLNIIKQSGFEGDPNDLYFHGTNFISSISIIRWIEIFPRITDFGHRNFYLSNSFKFAYQSVQCKQQKAIVVFHIPQNVFGDLNKLEFTMSNIDDWKNLVNKIRNPIIIPDLEYLINKNKAIQQKAKNKREYDNFISYVDSYDLVSGPICKNWNTNIDYMKYEDHIPFQYAFKQSSIDQLNNYKLFIILIKSSVRDV